MKRFGLLSMALATAMTVACNSNTRTDTRTSDEANATVGTAGVDRTVNASDTNFIDDMIADGTADRSEKRRAGSRGTKLLVSDGVLHGHHQNLHHHAKS